MESKDKILNLKYTMDINQIEIIEHKEEKQEYAELIAEVSDVDMELFEKADSALDSITFKFLKLGFTEEELSYLGIEPKSERIAKKNKNNSKKKEKKDSTNNGKKK